jgi:hypothetical protein
VNHNAEDEEALRRDQEERDEFAKRLKERDQEKTKKVELVFKHDNIAITHPLIKI